MLVNDRTEFAALPHTIGTMECRLSSIPCGYALNSDERSCGEHTNKPVYIRSRVSCDMVVASGDHLAHYPWLSGYVFY